jgi:hypothetical protein
MHKAPHRPKVADRCDDVASPIYGRSESIKPAHRNIRLTREMDDAVWLKILKDQLKRYGIANVNVAP